ncbi:MAG: iron chelate uptake ABC transporter family permease subunit, partial [Desulfobacterales bacterium]|nr:iron chelate uptake ABC transporter family permease subunit [Desulfobacterales bacterium]
MLRFFPLWPQLAVLAGILVVLAAAAAGMGHVQAGFFDVLRIVGSAISGIPELASGIDPIARAAVIEVRLPRILVAALVGGALGVSGAVYQGILLNPLADP